MIKCARCGYLRDGQCTVFKEPRIPSANACPAYSHYFEECHNCGQPTIPASLTLNHETLKGYCPQCALTLYHCPTCAAGQSCEFETNPSPTPKYIQKQVRQGNVIATIQEKNPSRVAELCKNCPCWNDKENACCKENNYCNKWKEKE